MQQKKITDEQFQKSFWMGIPKHIRNHLEACLFQVHPTLSLTTPFPIEFIIEAAEHVYDPTRFDQETDEASEDDSDDSDTTSDSDSEEEEMRLIPKKEKKKKKKKTDLKTKEQKAKDQVPTTVTPPS